MARVNSGLDIPLTKMNFIVTADTAIAAFTEVSGVEASVDAKCIPQLFSALFSETGSSTKLMDSDKMTASSRDLLPLPSTGL